MYPFKSSRNCWRTPETNLDRVIMKTTQDSKFRSVFGSEVSSPPFHLRWRIVLLDVSVQRNIHYVFLIILFNTDVSVKWCSPLLFLCLERDPLVD